MFEDRSFGAFCELAMQGNLVILAKLAEGITDPKNTEGEASKKWEDLVIENALPKVKSAGEAARFSEHFGTKTGRHRFLIAYVKENGIETEEDAAAILFFVRSFRYHGQEVVNTVKEAAAARNLDIGKPLAFFENSLKSRGNPIMAALAEAITEIVSEHPELGVRVGVVGFDPNEVPDNLKPFLKQEDGDYQPHPTCQCVECQIARVAAEPGNEFLAKHWREFKEELISGDLMVEKKPGLACFTTDKEEELKEQAEIFGLDPRVKAIFFEDLEKQKRGGHTPEEIQRIESAFQDPVPVTKVSLEVKFIPPHILEDQLKRLSLKGPIGNKKIPLPDGRVLTVSDLVAERPQGVPEELIEIFQKYL